MKIRYAESVDALCHRHCAFALYTLPDEQEVHFCMAKDGRSEENIILSNGFLLSTFTGQQLFIPAELTEPPVADTWEKSLPHTHGEASTREQYAALFELYTEFIRNGRVSKIVLARTEDTPVRQDFSPTEAFLKACNQHPSAFKALVHTPQHGTWLFCTPEQLITGCGNTWHTMALAGTRRPSARPWDAKNTQEQALVADFMRNILTPLADELHESAPENLRAGNIEHLCTRFTLRMPPERLPLLLEKLPPTPAVCGSPVEEARQILHTYPDIERSFYAGYLGPWGSGNVQLYVALRCMQIFPKLCRLYAGGGLMPDSCEQDEWLETADKMQTMRNTLSSAE